MNTTEPTFYPFVDGLATGMRTGGLASIPITRLVSRHSAVVGRGTCYELNDINNFAKNERQRGKDVTAEDFIVFLQKVLPEKSTITYATIAWSCFTHKARLAVCALYPHEARGPLLIRNESFWYRRAKPPTTTTVATPMVATPMVATQAPKSQTPWYLHGTLHKPTVQPGEHQEFYPIVAKTKDFAETRVTILLEEIQHKEHTYKMVLLMVIAILIIVIVYMDR